MTDDKITNTEKKLICAIKIRGQTGIRGDIKKTLEMLRLYKAKANSAKRKNFFILVHVILLESS